MAEIVDCLVGLTREEMYVAIRDTWHATVKETLIYAGDGAVLSNQMIQKFADAVAGRSKRELEAALRLILGSVEVVINAKLNAAIDRLSDSTKAWPIRMGDL